MTKFDSSEMAVYAFKFWFNDQEHIRSPFPFYIQNDLEKTTVEQFQSWLEGLHMDASDEVDEEMMAEKFEQLLFESALPLIKTEDERISILYPFLPRIGDQFIDEDQIESTVKDRFIKQEGESSFLHVQFEKIENKEKWNTSFELTI